MRECLAILLLPVINVFIVSIIGEKMGRCNG
jgi:hypothetical protein